MNNLNLRLFSPESYIQYIEDYFGCLEDVLTFLYEEDNCIAFYVFLQIIGNDKYKNHFLQEFTTSETVDIVLSKCTPKNSHKFLKKWYKEAAVSGEWHYQKKHTMSVAETTLEKFESTYRFYGNKSRKVKPSKRTIEKNKQYVRKRILGKNEKNDDEVYIYGLSDW